MKSSNLFINKIIYMFLSTFFLLQNVSFSQSGWFSLTKKGNEFGNTIQNIQFVDENNGFASGSMGFFIATTNGGLDWTRRSSASYINFMSMYFANSETGYLSGMDFSSQGSKVFKTTNAGINWTEILFLKKTPSNIFSFLDERTGLIPAYSFFNCSVYKTVNGGENWNIENIPACKTLMAVKFADENTVFAIGSGVFKSADKGNNWTDISAPETNQFELEYFCAVSSSLIFITTNNYQFGNCYILRSSDGGSSWTVIQPGFKFWLRSLFFLDDKTGYAAGNSVGKSGILLKTTDSGLTWVQQPIDAQDILWSISFINGLTGYTAGEYGKIYKTTTGGE